MYAQIDHKISFKGKKPIFSPKIGQNRMKIVIITSIPSSLAKRNFKNVFFYLDAVELGVVCENRDAEDEHVVRH
jgi:hypothetical protein